MGVDAILEAGCLTTQFINDRGNDVAFFAFEELDISVNEAEIESTSYASLNNINKSVIESIANFPFYRVRIDFSMVQTKRPCFSC